MTRLLLLSLYVSLNLQSYANNITVKNIEELNFANKNAIPGDIIILQNGEWANVIITLNCNGSKENPITFKSQTPGKVLITGNSKLKIGGQYIIVDGFSFINGYAGKDAVISFRVDNKQIANNCRVTNTVINDYNNPKRTEENNWVALYGKNNRLDHCNFTDKKNMGVLLAVLLDDERSRENFHSIDHNYFGRRLPLASNGGEIIRVGLSQHCQFNSNTQIKDNFFEQCDGETEIISIKSCSNVVEANVFKESQGSVVLRHGDNNIVKGNYFLGNDKVASGGIRIINKGQKVFNNIFYKCRGAGFRSPLAIMNGIPNSPANRYVQVIDAEISNNIFYECAPVSLCEGSDTERTLPPVKVLISKNTFYNTRDSIIYITHDDIKGILFEDNNVTKDIDQVLAAGFNKLVLQKQKPLSMIEDKIFKSSGATWTSKKSLATREVLLTVKCKTVEDIYKQLERKKPMLIRLTGKKYFFAQPVVINSNIEIQSGLKGKISLGSAGNMISLFVIKGSASLRISQTHFIADDVQADNFISSDTSGIAEHYSLIFDKSSISGLRSRHFFYAYKSSLADSIIIRSNSFANCYSTLFSMNEETEDKGYYNAEKIFISHNNFDNLKGTLLDIYRGGIDESTLGPALTFSHNKIFNYNSADNIKSLIVLTGVQQSEIFSNIFFKCNYNATLITYKDNVRAEHNFERNIISNSGRLEINKYVTEKGNTIK